MGSTGISAYFNKPAGLAKIHLNFDYDKIFFNKGSIVGHWLFSDVVAPKGAIFSNLQCNVESPFDGAGRSGSYKSRFLILGCSTSGLHHSWNNLVQNVINIFCTLLRRDFPLSELLYAIYQLLLVAWFDLSFHVELEFMPQVFDWVEVRTLWRSMPPVNAFLLKESMCPLGHVFGIIVLHEPVVGKFVSHKWDERCP